MASVAERFKGKVRRSGRHQLWTGATDAAGVGQMRINGKLTTARRVAWELAHGPHRQQIRNSQSPLLLPTRPSSAPKHRATNEGNVRSHLDLELDNSLTNRFGDAFPAASYVINVPELVPEVVPVFIAAEDGATHLPPALAR